MTDFKIPYVNLSAQYKEERSFILDCVEEVFSSGRFVNGPRITELEHALADHAGTAEAVALGSGTAALILSLRIHDIGAGDEVITVPNSFFATAGAIVAVNARPVFVDVGDDMNIDCTKIEAAITSRTKAIMPVHLTGRVADMDAIMRIAAKNGLVVIEDAAQAFGAQYRGKYAGTFGHIGCFSAHPLKNLNAPGDAGFVLTNDKDIAEHLRRARNHGLLGRDTIVSWGENARMDVLHAMVLLNRLSTLTQLNERRRYNAALYRKKIHVIDVAMPQCRDHEFNIFHTFVIRTKDRDGLRSALADDGIETAIHYPIPIHLQAPARALGYKPGDFPMTEDHANTSLSLPIHQYLEEADLIYISDVINRYFGV